MITRQGEETEHAVMLLKYRSAKHHPYLVHWNGLLTSRKDAEFPPAMSGIEEDFRTAPMAFRKSPSQYARRFYAQTVSQAYKGWFLAEEGDSGYMTAEQYLQKMQKAQESYLEGGGEKGYE
jgi:hypothetical protein